MTTTTTTTVPEQLAHSFYVDAKHEGFAFEPDEAIGFAVAELLIVQADGFDRELAAARNLAAADEASKLSRPKRAELASVILVDHPTRKGYALSMSASTYSKRVRAGRATDDQVLEFLMVCDTPSLDKLYEWLPKMATGRPKGSKSAPKVAPEPETAPEPVSEPETVTPCRWDSDHINTAAMAIINSLRAQGADDPSMRLVAGEVMRLLSPVRSAGGFVQDAA